MGLSLALDPPPNVTCRIIRLALGLRGRAYAPSKARSADDADSESGGCPNTLH